jgi:protein tyrosine phosphatase
MVEQENSSLIVMLTHTKEANKVKCHQYWPAEIQENDTQTGIVYDTDKEVSLVSVESLMPNLIKRKMKLTHKDPTNGTILKTRFVTQLQYLTWPDHGAPEETDFEIIKTILDFVGDHHKKAMAWTENSS